MKLRESFSAEKEQRSGVIKFMKFKKTKFAALALASLLAAGSFSGCALVTNNLKKDLEQVVASVDLTKSEDYSSLKGTIKPSDVLKRDLVASYASVGSTYVNSYGMEASTVYEMLKNQLVNRQLYVQYAQAYFLDTDSTKTKSEWDKKIAEADESEKEIAALAYFLDKDEIETAEYTVKSSMNATLDSQELQYIETEEDEHDHDTARTTPNGLDTVKEDYYDPAYKIYTGYNAASDCGTYEAQEGSTPTTRMKAYKTLLSNLHYYGLVSKGEDTSDITKLAYYNSERKSQYETQLINKLGEVFEEQAKEKVREEWVKEEKYQTTLASQKEQFGGSDASALESALDGVSDTSFVLYAPDNYGFVINILLPFSSRQTQELNDSEADFGDVKGNKFVKRASLLKGLVATDQRNTWFTGHEDYSYEAGTDNAYTADNADRKYLFFEDSMKKTVGTASAPAQYEKIPNYLGQYTYNGKVFESTDEDGDKVYNFQPAKLSIEGFLSEMKGYLKYAGFSLKQVGGKAYYPNGTEDAYYAQESYYAEDGTVDYSKFLYYEAQVDFTEHFNACHIFQDGSQENRALSVINELSFAYNTDTAGLNTYLGYVVSPNNTDFVKEFEYAAQEAVRGGPGTITVAPSDYGWHIMYCTFAYSKENPTPYGNEFNWDEIEVEGTFSNLYYEALTAENFSSYSSELQTSVLNKYNNDTCVVVYEDRYKDLYEA